MMSKQECLSIGTCADAFGNVGNGSAYENKSQACSNAKDCGLFNESCKWIPTNGWKEQHKCVDYGRQTKGSCLLVDGNIWSPVFVDAKRMCKGTNCKR